MSLFSKLRFPKIKITFADTPDPVSSALEEEKTVSVSDFLLPMTAQELLDTPKNQQLLNNIWKNVSMSPEQYKKYILKPIENYAELVQLFPASESHHHAKKGGLLEHGLEVIANAGKLRQNYILPQNAPSEEQAKQKDIWTAIVVYGAILHDIGKIGVDIEVVCEDKSHWSPWLGKLTKPYRFRYRAKRDYDLHPCVGSTLLSMLLPEEVLHWLSMNPVLFSSLLYFASGHTHKAGILSEIIQKADQHSVAKAIGGDVSKLSTPAVISFATQLHMALTEVVKKMTLNMPNGGGQGFLTEEGLWVMSKSTADNIRAHLATLGVSCPKDNSRLFDELQQHHLIIPTSNNSANWRCEVESETGWTANFSGLFRIMPSVIWENIDDRPLLFTGTVTAQNDKGEAIVIDKFETETKAETPAENTLQPTTDTTINLTENADTAVQTTTKAQESEAETPTHPLTEYNQEKDHALMNATYAMLGIEMPSAGNPDTAQNNEDNEETDADQKNACPENRKNLTPLPTEESNETDKNYQKTDTAEEEPNLETALEEKRKHYQRLGFGDKKLTINANKKPKISQSEPKKKKIALPPSLQTTQKETTGTVPHIFKTKKVSKEDFVEWIKINFANKKLTINSQDSRLHFVKDHLFMVTPGIFQDYIIEKTGRTNQEDWEYLQKEFQTLNLHTQCWDRVEKDKRNFWTVDIIGGKNTSKLTGYLIENYQYFLGKRQVFNNKHIILDGEFSND